MKARLGFLLSALLLLTACIQSTSDNLPVYQCKLIGKLDGSSMLAWLYYCPNTPAGDCYFVNNTGGFWCKPSTK